MGLDDEDSNKPGPGAGSNSNVVVPSLDEINSSLAEIEGDDDFGDIE